jgi:organic hydroperoxide reductase OsmC/OhrA
VPAPFPHRYRATLSRTSGSRGRVEALPRAAIATSPSPELDGDATAWSGEHLLLAAIAQSLQLTFEAFATHERVEVFAFVAEVSAEVVRTREGLALRDVHVELDLEVDDVDGARIAVALAERHCVIANALRAPVTIAANVRGLQLRAG